MRPARLTALVVLILPTLAEAGAWTRAPGSFYANLSYGRISSGTYFAPNFEQVPIRRYTQHTLGFYGEAGVIERWLTVSLDAQLYRRNSLAQLGTTDGLSDAQLGFWTGLLRSPPFHLSLGVLVGLPLGDPFPKAGPGADAEAAQIAASLPTGDGEVDVESRLALGTSFGGGRWPLRHFLSLQVGYWLRTQGFADAFTYAFQLGFQFPWTFINRFWFIFRFHGVESFASNEEAAQNPTGLGNGVTYTSYGFQALARLWKGVSVGVGIDSALRARSVAAGANLRVLVSFEL